MIRFVCPAVCGPPHTYELEDRFAGCRIHCPQSGQPIMVPIRRLTEETWERGSEPNAMLRVLRRFAGRRKMRLFTAACIRILLSRFADARVEIRVATVERYADGLTTRREVKGAHRVLSDVIHRTQGSSPWTQHVLQRLKVMGGLEEEIWITPPEVGEQERRQQCDLLRELFGNPFCCTLVLSSWLLANDGAVVKLARGIYDEAASDRMPILGDALEEAGCTDRVMLDHCRSRGPHARGCWVVDLLVGNVCESAKEEVTG